MVRRPLALIEPIVLHAALRDRLDDAEPSRAAAHRLTERLGAVREGASGPDPFRAASLSYRAPSWNKARHVGQGRMDSVRAVTARRLFIVSNLSRSAERGR